VIRREGWAEEGFSGSRVSFLICDLPTSTLGNLEAESREDQRLLQLARREARFPTELFGKNDYLFFLPLSDSVKEGSLEGVGRERELFEEVEEEGAEVCESGHKIRIIEL
jgi:hypothetical protein